MRDGSSHLADIVGHGISSIKMDESEWGTSPKCCLKEAEGMEGKGTRRGEQRGTAPSCSSHRQNSSRDAFMRVASVKKGILGNAVLNRSFLLLRVTQPFLLLKTSCFLVTQHIFPRSRKAIHFFSILCCSWNCCKEQGGRRPGLPRATAPTSYTLCME